MKSIHELKHITDDGQRDAIVTEDIRIQMEKDRSCHKDDVSIEEVFDVIVQDWKSPYSKAFRTYTNTFYGCSRRDYIETFVRSMREISLLRKYGGDAFTEEQIEEVVQRIATIREISDDELLSIIGSDNWNLEDVKIIKQVYGNLLDKRNFCEDTYGYSDADREGTKKVWIELGNKNHDEMKEVWIELGNKNIDEMNLEEVEINKEYVRTKLKTLDKEVSLDCFILCPVLFFVATRQNLMFMILLGKRKKWIQEVN